METHTTHQRGHILKLILIWYGQNKNQIYMYGLKVKVQTSAVHVTWYHQKVQPRISIYIIDLWKTCPKVNTLIN